MLFSIDRPPGQIRRISLITGDTKLVIPLSNQNSADDALLFMSFTLRKVKFCFEANVGGSKLGRLTTSHINFKTI